MQTYSSPATRKSGISRRRFRATLVKLCVVTDQLNSANSAVAVDSWNSHQYLHCLFRPRLKMSELFWLQELPFKRPMKALRAAHDEILDMHYPQVCFSSNTSALDADQTNIKQTKENQ